MIGMTSMLLTGGAIFAGLRAYRAQPLVTAPIMSEPDQVNSLGTAVQAVLANEEAREQTIISLTGTTTAIHLLLGLHANVPLFIVSGAGFVVLVAGRYALPDHKVMIDDAFMAYTGTTVAAYFASLGMASLFNPMGLVTKLVELGLLSALWVDAQPEIAEVVPTTA